MVHSLTTKEHLAAGYACLVVTMCSSDARSCLCFGHTSRMGLTPLPFVSNILFASN
jgi:hypothetical protein